MPVYLLAVKEFANKVLKYESEFLPARRKQNVSRDRPVHTRLHICGLVQTAAALSAKCQRPVFVRT